MGTRRDDHPTEGSLFTLPQGPFSPCHFQTRCGHTVRWAIGPPAPEAIRPPSVSGLFMRPALS